MRPAPPASHRRRSAIFAAGPEGAERNRAIDVARAGPEPRDLPADFASLRGYPLYREKGLPDYPNCERELGPVPGLGPGEIVNFGARAGARFADAASDPGLIQSSKRVPGEVVERATLSTSVSAAAGTSSAASCA